MHAEDWISRPARPPPEGPAQVHNEWKPSTTTTVQNVYFAPLNPIYPRRPPACDEIDYSHEVGWKSTALLSSWMTAGPGPSRRLGVWPEVHSPSRGDAWRLSVASERTNQERPSGRHFSSAREEGPHANAAAQSRQEFCVRTLDRLPSRGSALSVCGHAGRYNGSLRSNGSFRIREPADTGTPSGSGHSHLFTVSHRNDSTCDQVVAPQIQVERPAAGPFLTPADIEVKRRDADGSCAAVPAPALVSPAPWGWARLHASTAGQRTSTLKYCSQTR